MQRIIICSLIRFMFQSVDMTPSNNAIASLLGGSITFVGQIPSVQVVVIQLRNPPATARPNQHRLPHPMQNETSVRGDMVLLRMDEDAQPQSISLAEWRAAVGEQDRHAQSGPARTGTKKRLRK